MHRRDRLERMKEFWFRLQNSAVSNKVSHDLFQRIKNTFKLEYGLSENTLRDYIDTLMHSGALSNNFLDSNAFDDELHWKLNLDFTFPEGIEE